MQRHFINELNSLKDHIIKMATMVDDQISTAFQSLETNNEELREVIRATEREIDAYDNLIQTLTENLLALFQPVATDLRFIKTAIMVTNQLERCGDIAVNISQRVKKTINYGNLIEESEILVMGKIANSMLKESMYAFIHGDSQLAKTIIKKDDFVDEMNKKIFDFLTDKMAESIEFIKPGAHLLILSRHIERLADHATNIAEDVIFMVDARLVAHAKRLGLTDD
jgi:phosphate transport system protein